MSLNSGITPAVSRELRGVLGIKFRPATCKASALPVVPLLQSQSPAVGTRKEHVERILLIAKVLKPWGDSDWPMLKQILFIWLFGDVAGEMFCLSPILTIQRVIFPFMTLIYICRYTCIFLTIKIKHAY